MGNFLALPLYWFHWDDCIFTIQNEGRVSKADEVNKSYMRNYFNLGINSWRWTFFEPPL